MKTFEEYLRDAFKGTSTDKPGFWIDHQLRCDVSGDTVSFYVHPSGVGGETLHFIVKGNSLERDPRITYLENDGKRTAE